MGSLIGGSSRGNYNRNTGVNSSFSRGYSGRTSEDRSLTAGDQADELEKPVFQGPPVDPYKAIMATARAQKDARDLLAQTPDQFFQPGGMQLSPQGQLGYVVDPSRVPADLQDQIRGGFYSQNPSSNYTYDVMPNQFAALAGGRGGGGGASFSVPSAAENDTAEAQAYALEQANQRALAARMYPTSAVPAAAKSEKSS